MVVIEKNSTSIGSLGMKELGWEKRKGLFAPEEKKGEGEEGSGNTAD